MASSLQCNDQARPLKRKNENLADDDDDETTRQTKQARRDGHSEAHSSQQEENLSSNTVPPSPQKRDNVPQEIWDLIVQFLEKTSEKKWSCELHNNLDDPYLDLDGGERRLVKKTLYNLTLTSRIPHKSAMRALYRSICLRGTKSAVLLFRTLKRRPNDRFPNDTLFCYNIRDYIRELIILGPLAEYKCCKVLAVQEWPDKASPDSTIHKAIKRWESWKGLELQRNDKDSLEPMVVAATMAELFRMTPQLHTLAIMDAFIPHRLACEYLGIALFKMGRKEEKDDDENKAHAFPNLSTFVLLGARGVRPTDWAPLIQRFSEYGIKNLHLKHLNRSISVPRSVGHLQLSYEQHGDLDLSKVKYLSSLEVYLGAKAPFIFGVPNYFSAPPTSLTSLRVNSGYIASYAMINFSLKPSMLPHLRSLQMPMALLFENPRAMQGITGVTDLFPSTLLSMELLEVWLEDSRCGDNYDNYGDKMAAFLQIVLRDLPHLESFKFREQWEHWRYSLANQKKRLLKIDTAPLFPETSSVLCQRASAYLHESTLETIGLISKAIALEALSLVSKAIALEPRNRKALILQAQIQATLGLAEEAAKTIASTDSPVHPHIKDPIERMLAHVNTAREYLRKDPERAILALDSLMEGRHEGSQPREWKLMRSNAYLLLLPKTPRRISKALNIALELIRKKKDDVDALFLAGQASYEQGKYNKAVMYLQKANCYSPERSDIVKWLEDVEAQGGVV